MTTKLPIWGTLTLVLALFTELGLAQEASEEPDQFAKLAPHLSLLNELSERRRPNTFFPNEQSQTYGVQVDYVNVGRGNLTFVRRDLVTVGRIPIVAGRVYDSAAGDAGDFGPGWRFALAETIEATQSGDLRYTDESGSVETLFATGDDEFSAEYTQLSDVLRAERNDKRIVISLRGGWTKDFEETDGVYRLVKVSDHNGNKLKLNYESGQLAAVQGDNRRSIQIERSGTGQIAKISDDQGREVRYEYKSGRLSTVIDLGGNRWKYKYYPSGQLKRIVDPLDQKALAARYDSDGRVATANIRHRKNSFAYNGATTTVTNGRGLSTSFTQGAAGITTKVVNAAGTSTEITLDQKLLPTMRKLNGELRTTFIYNGEGRLSSMTSYDSNETVDRSYTFDWISGQIESMISSDGTYFEFKYDNKGRLKKKRTEKDTTRYKYHGNGDLKEVRVDGDVARQFEYNDDGQLAWMSDAGVEAIFRYDGIGHLKRVEMPDSEPFEYEYNALGLRTLSEVVDSTTTFTFDAAGRLRAFATTRDGEVTTGYEYTLDVDNLTRQATAHNGEIITIDYDGTGNPISYGTSDREHEYSYDDLGRFVGVQPMHGDPIRQSYRLDEAGWRGRADTRTGINLMPEQTASAIYGSHGEIFLGRGRGVGLLPVIYEASSATLQAINNLGFVPPDSAQRAALSRSRVDSMSEDPDERAVSFNRPSSSFFLPPEMNQANCFQMCSVWEVVVIIANSNPQVGESVRFRSSGAADDVCIMHNDWTWGDGTTGFSSGHFSTIYKTYSSPGTKSGSVVAACTCLGLSARADWTVSVQAMQCGVQNTNVAHPVDGCSIPEQVTRRLLSLWGGTRNDPMDGEVGRHSTAFGKTQGSIPHSQINKISSLPCNQHDLCYQTCGSSRLQCDTALASAALAVCTSAYRPDPVTRCPYFGQPGGVSKCAKWAIESVNCPIVAAAVGAAVLTGGGPAFSERQRQHCTCGRRPN